MQVCVVKQTDDCPKAPGRSIAYKPGEFWEESHTSFHFSDIHPTPNDAPQRSDLLLQPDGIKKVMESQCILLVLGGAAAPAAPRRGGCADRGGWGSGAVAIASRWG